MVYKKDNRKFVWSQLESEIQKSAKNKDKKFKLSGKWKKFLRKRGGFSLFVVDGDWVRNNLSVIFGHGGHGYVHEFIPANEVWVGWQHPPRCGCKKVNKDRKQSKPYFESVALHEITEAKRMKGGVAYWKAHQLALKKEMEAGLVPDPYSEIRT